MRWVLALLITASGALADPQTDRARAAFEAWLRTHDTPGVLAIIGPNGREVMAFGRAPDAPADLASLSKAITGVCVAALVDEGLLSYDDTVAGLLGRGPDSTVSQLLTHSSGLQVDATQRLMPGWYEDTGDRAGDVLDAVIARGGPTGKVGGYVYNNENYALLGLMIEAAAGAPYESTCRMRVLDPVGASAQRSDKTGAYLPWGGWEMRPSDYVAFQAHWFGAGSTYATDPFRHPHLPLGKGAHYGIGPVFRALEDGRMHVVHHGAICLPGRMEASSFAATWFGVWHAFVAYETCVEPAEMIALDLLLYRALFDDE